MDLGAQVAQWIRLLANNQKVVSSNLVQAVVCSSRLPRGTFNRGAVCVRMHLRSCADLKEPGWPSESPGVRKQTDRAGMHKHPENGMWLPTGGQIENGHIRISSSAQGDCKRKKEYVHHFDVLVQLTIDRHDNNESQLHACFWNLFQWIKLQAFLPKCFSLFSCLYY